MIYWNYSNRNCLEPLGSDRKPVGNNPSGPIGIWSDRFDKFPTIWVVLCSRISNRNPSGSDWFRLENVGHRQDLRFWKIEDRVKTGLNLDNNNDTVHFFLSRPKFCQEFMIARQTPWNWRIFLMISWTLHLHHRLNVMNLSTICSLRWKMLRMALFGSMRGTHPFLVYHIWPVIIFQFWVSMIKFIFFTILYL